MSKLSIPNEIAGAESLAELLDAIHGKERPVKGNGTYKEKEEKK